MKTYKHSAEFWKNKFKEYKAEVRAIGGTALKKNAFVSAYKAFMVDNENLKAKGEKPISPMRELVYGSKYGTRLATARAEYRSLKAAGIKGVKMEDLKLMETTDFANIYAAQLMQAYKDFRASGATGKQAKLLISQQWFGSK